MNSLGPGARLLLCSAHLLRRMRVALLLSSLLLTSLPAVVPRVLPPGQLPDDIRLQAPKDLDGYFPFTPPATAAEWAARSAQVRRQILVSQGLWPMPTRGPLQAVVHGRIEREDYAVEKVYFESAPGFFVTGSLYRPLRPVGRVPVVLFAHGHWKDARLSEETEAKLRQEIATGQERFEQGGRSRFQAMCVQLARMGCMVWQWDMLSDSDARQFSAQVIHRFAKQRPEMNTVENWGLYSTPAESRLQSVMGLQTWNAVRSLDFVLSLPEVDPERVAITGASGGGTQTMLLAAIDSRVKLSFPAVMVSTAMQGGCTCENSSLLRIGTGNVEFAALFAPGPQGMTTANDWTREMSTKGFPQLQRLYALLGAPKHVHLHRGEHFPHNYNAVSRSAFHTFLNQHFRLGQKEPVVERDYVPLTRDQLTVWGPGHPAPKSEDPDFERALLRWFAEDARRQLEATVPQPARFRELVGGGFAAALGRDRDAAGVTRWIAGTTVERGDFRELAGRVRNETHREELPAVLLEPAKPSGRVVLWADSAGKSGLRDAQGGLRPEVFRLLRAGHAVLAADLLFLGEFVTEGGAPRQTRVVRNPRESAAYTHGYNSSLFAQRAHDILTLTRFARESLGIRQVDLLGLGELGPVAVAARALAGGEIARAAVFTGGFRFASLLDYRDPRFLPGGAKYLDVPGLLALSAPHPLWVAGEPEGEAIASGAYAAAASASNLQRHRGPAEGGLSAALDWLLR
ncbi:MAG: acetylxylan esterase [Verrucomicrobia bacterium]|nr:acetylxylan esterase [Verrucomicrobiota bacterium]